MSVVEISNTRGEKKTRKVIIGEGLKSVEGIDRVTFTHGQDVYRLDSPDVFKSSNSNTHIVFSEMKVEDMTSKAQATFAEQMAVEAENQEAKPTQAEATVEEGEGREEEADATGVEEESIRLIVF